MALPLERPPSTSSWFSQGIAVVRGWPWRLLGALGGLVLLLLLALVGYQASARPATLVVDGVSVSLRTHQRLVGGILREAGITLGPGDEVSPPLDYPWQPDQAIVVEHAFPVTIRADGRTEQFFGRPRSLLEILARAGVTLHPADDVYVNSTLVPEAGYSDEMALRRVRAQHMAVWHLAASPPPVLPLQVEIVRAVPVYVHDDGLELEVRTTAPTAGAALEEAGFRIYRADQLYPPPDTPVSAGLHLYIDRAIPLTVVADRQNYETRTRATTVAAALQEEGLSLGPQDYIVPAAETPLQPGMTIRIVRVTTLDLVETSAIPYLKRQEPDPSMELDQHRLRQGQEGLLERATRITSEDGREVKRESLGERVAYEPVDEVFYYGTRIVVRTLETPYGTIEYWRKLRVLATSYFPSTCDKTPDDPEYGITYTGKRATRGIIAVDPRVIRLHTRLYVPDYGLGAAEDIGGMIKGRHIDLCFDDADQGGYLWDMHYVDVYLLTPVPPPERIPWILP